VTAGRRVLAGRRATPKTTAPVTKIGGQFPNVTAPGRRAPPVTLRATHTHDAAKPC